MVFRNVLLLVLAASVSAQFQGNNLAKADQYDSQGNLLQRTPSFLANSGPGGGSFGTHTSNSNRAFGRNNQNTGFNRPIGGNPNQGFGQGSQFRSHNQLNSVNPFGQQQQFSQQQQLGQSQQQLFGQNRQAQFGQSQQQQFGQNRQAQFGQNQQQQFRTAEGSATVINSRSENDGFGQYSFGYETDNGIVREETGQATGLDSYAVSGSYSYTSPEGIEVTVRYIADENGFQVESPNLPPVPLHAQQQILAAREAKSRGLIDESGNPTQQQGQFRASGGNNRQNSNLFNLVNQNRNFATNQQDQTGLNRFAGGLSQQQQLNSQSRFSNLQRTAVLRRPLDGNLDGRQGNFLQQNQNFNSDRFTGGLSQLQTDPFGSNHQGFRSSQNSRPFRQSNAAELFSSNRRSGQFVTPSFQNQIASRLTVDEGGSFRSAAQQAALTHGSDIISDSTGNVASYRVSS